MTMSTKENLQNDNLTRLETVDEEKAEILRKNNFDTYKDIAKASIGELSESCNITLSSAIQISSSAFEQLELECPACGSDNVISSNEAMNGFDVEGEIVCQSCRWNGDLDDV